MSHDTYCLLCWCNWRMAKIQHSFNNTNYKVKYAKYTQYIQKFVNVLNHYCCYTVKHTLIIDILKWEWTLSLYLVVFFTYSIIFLVPVPGPDCTSYDPTSWIYYSSRDKPSVYDEFSDTANCVKMYGSFLYRQPLLTPQLKVDCFNSSNMCLNEAEFGENRLFLKILPGTCMVYIFIHF